MLDASVHDESGAFQTFFPFDVGTETEEFVGRVGFDVGTEDLILGYIAMYVIEEQPDATR